jgi:hypothetical protein
VPFYFVGLLMNQLHLISLSVTIDSFHVLFSDCHVRALPCYLSSFYSLGPLVLVAGSWWGCVRLAPPFLVGLVYNFLCMFWFLKCIGIFQRYYSNSFWKSKESNKWQWS